MELQKERQRELDLRQSGVIHTISEERAGEHTKFVEVFSSPEDRAAKMEVSALCSIFTISIIHSIIFIIITFVMTGGGTLDFRLFCTRWGYLIFNYFAP